MHLTLGILRTSQAVFYALAFFWLDGSAKQNYIREQNGLGMNSRNSNNWLLFYVLIGVLLLIIICVSIMIIPINFFLDGNLYQ